MSSDPSDPTHTFQPALTGDVTVRTPAGDPRTAPYPTGAVPPVGADGVAGFTLLRELGRGGMGVVHLARQHVPGRLVAFKMVLAGANAGPELLERFRLEGEAIARLSHPGVVQVFACGQAGALPYMVLEYVDGTALDRVALPLPPRAAAELLLKVARAVEYAHRRGVVHRDLKPGNILLTAAGEPKVTDFGLAKFDPALAPTLNDQHATTRSGAILGSPRYMAPEQAAGRVADIGPATDVHALGLTLYELLTGKPAFEGLSLLHTLEQVRTTEPAPVRAVTPAVPRDLETVCAKCLQKDPGKRYPTAAELADDLQRFLGGEPILARPVPAWERAAKWARRNPEDAVVRGIIGIILLVVFGPELLQSTSAQKAAIGIGVGAVVLQQLRWWRRGLALGVIGVLVAFDGPWIWLGGLLFGALCGLTGRLAGRRWGASAPSVTLMAVVCGLSAFLFVAFAFDTAFRQGWGWEVWREVVVLAATTAAIVGGGAWYARSRSAGAAAGARP